MFTGIVTRDFIIRRTRIRKSILRILLKILRVCFTGSGMKLSVMHSTSGTGGLDTQNGTGHRMTCGWTRRPAQRNR